MLVTEARSPIPSGSCYLTLMITCFLCGKSFKSITPSHLRARHNTTLLNYLKRFPSAPVYSEDRYRGNTPADDRCPVCGSDMFDGVCTKAHGHETTTFELGLSCLKRYECDTDLADAGTAAARCIASQAWTKQTRARIEELFDERYLLRRRKL